MEYKTLLIANFKKHKGGLVGIFLLTLFVATALETVLSVWLNSNTYIKDQIQRVGFGDLTVWVSNISEISKLVEDIEKLPEIDRVDTQNLIFSNYTVKEQESDSEGQLITYSQSKNRYRFFKEDLTGYLQDTVEIKSGEIYVSPSMISMFDIHIGDEITFPIARSRRNIVFTVKGFYEDPFMGSSMIGMKGFLICESDRTKILSILQNAGIDALARGGAMLHIFSSDHHITVSELNSILNQNTSLANYTEFVHSKDAIAGFMLILQNAFSGLLAAFTLVLLFVVIIVLSHNISSTIKTDTVNMGILKTFGFTSFQLRLLQLFQYVTVIIIGMFFGFLLSIPFNNLVSDATITTTGIRIPTNFPFSEMLLSFAAIVFLLIGFILLKTRKIVKVKPIQAIRKETEKITLNPKRSICVLGKGIYFRLALRQLITGKYRYIGAFMISIILVFFASLIGRMNTWLGADGKGMMDAFNPADHDIGVQVFGTLNTKDAEMMVRSYTEITDTYLLAMPNVAINGVDYTANVISDPKRFHILKGRTCTNDHEVVLTEFVAANFGISIGDTVIIQGDSDSEEYVVSGIYSCANDMGDNIGMNREGYLRIGNDNPNIWCLHYFLADTSKKALIIQDLEDTYGGDIHVHENTWPGLFGIILAMQALMIFMYGMVIIFIFIVTIMTGSKILTAEQMDLGIYKAIGFQIKHLRFTFSLRFGLLAVLGSVIGILLSSAFTDPIVSSVMKLAGISNFSSSPSLENTLLPAGIVTFLFTGFAYLASKKIEKNNLTALISK